MPHLILGFLNHELKLNGIKTKIEDLCPVIDTLELSKEQRPGTMHNLDALCRRFGVDTSCKNKTWGSFRCSNSCSSLYSNDWWPIQSYFKKLKVMNSELTEPFNDQKKNCK